MLPRKPHHKGFKKPDYPALLAKRIAKRKPGAMEMEYAKPGHVPMLCEVCGALSFVSPRRLRTGPNRCLVHRKKSLKAKPDAKLAAWARKVKARDGNECQVSRFRGLGAYGFTGIACSGVLDAHHIAEKSLRPDLKYELSNGIALCRRHHSWIPLNRAEAIRIGVLSDATYEAAQKEMRAA
jgi:hypothetical protein